MAAVAISSSRSARAALPLIRNGSRAGVSENRRTVPRLTRFRLTLPIRQVAKPPLADLGVVEEGHVLVARVAQDAAVELVHRGAAPLEHLEEDVALGGGAEDAGEAVRGVVGVGLLEDRGDERLVDRSVGAAGVEEADEHLFSPYFVRPARSERNSRLRSGFFRNEPRMMLFVIFESESFTPRHFMQ